MGETYKYLNDFCRLVRLSLILGIIGYSFFHILTTIYNELLNYPFVFSVSFLGSLCVIGSIYCFVKFPNLFTYTSNEEKSWSDVDEKVIGEEKVRIFNGFSLGKILIHDKKRLRYHFLFVFLTFIVFGCLASVNIKEALSFSSPILKALISINIIYVIVFGFIIFHIFIPYLFIFEAYFRWKSK